MVFNIFFQTLEKKIDYQNSLKFLQSNALEAKIEQNSAQQ